MTTVLLGNTNPQMTDPDGTSRPADHVNQSITTVQMWDGFDDQDFVDLTLSTDNDRMLSMIARTLNDEDRHYAVGISELEQVVTAHAAGTKPAWVTSDDAEFARVIGQHFSCPVGEPTMLLTTVGRDALHSQHLNTAAQPAASNSIALTANATAPSAASTTLTAEIATGGGGLIRAQATYAHTGSTNTTTLTKTFTANGSDALPVTLAKIGVFNASSVGTLAYETLLNATATLTISGDNVTVTETVTAG